MELIKQLQPPPMLPELELELELEPEQVLEPVLVLALELVNTKPPLPQIITLTIQTENLMLVKEENPMLERLV